MKYSKWYRQSWKGLEKGKPQRWERATQSRKEAEKVCEHKELELLDTYLSYFSQPDMSADALVYFMGEISSFKYLDLQYARWRVAFAILDNISLFLLLLERPSFIEELFSTGVK